MNTRSRSHERVQYPGETSNALKTVFVIRKLFEGETQDGKEEGGGPGMRSGQDERGAFRGGDKGETDERRKTTRNRVHSRVEMAERV